MWWIKTDSTGEERGGFQDRDAGRSNIRKDYGPEYGIDYARFADPPDIARDLHLQSKIRKAINLENFLLNVRNGFVIIKGLVPDHETRTSIITTLKSVEGVVEVIPDIQILEH
jgi:hypothetical protein